jgi:hypothetical protein
MRIRAKELHQAWKRKKEAYKLRTRAEAPAPEPRPAAKPSRAKKGES